MAVKYEWKITRAGRRYVRTVVSDTPADATPEPEPEPEPEPAKHYMTKAELVALAEARGVDSSGTRPELMERLALDD